MRSFFVALLLLVGPTAGFAQESIKVAVLKQPPPESVAAPSSRQFEWPGISNSGRPGSYDRRYLAAEGDSRLRETGGTQGSGPVSVPGRRRAGRGFAIRDRGARLSRSAHREGRLHDALRLAAGQWRSSGREHLSRLFAASARGERSIAGPPAPQATRGAERRISRDEPPRRLSVAGGTA